MKYLLKKIDVDVVNDIIIAMPSSTKGEPHEHPDSIGGAMLEAEFGVWEYYEHEQLGECLLFKNIKALHKYMHAGIYRLKCEEERRSARYFIKSFCRARDIKRETLKEGGLNMERNQEETFPDSKRVPKISQEEQKIKGIKWNGLVGKH